MDKRFLLSDYEQQAELGGGVERRQRQHDAEKEPDRHQERDVLQRREAEDGKHGVLGKLAGRCIVQDLRELITHQYGEQHKRHQQTGGKRFAQYVAV